ncbi:hypothetical protein BD289DRAFT_288643 [Coniella lustricola]|uniref:Uncharacterized protein n=1 Tax=Coniella lustricola TaxID=2025994 RepID=A0A2T3A5G4_9PEZI|nr:hypothetical protein BD289DRAFT_288643 [Coniella lustricola]
MHPVCAHALQESLRVALVETVTYLSWINFGVWPQFRVDSLSVRLTDIDGHRQMQTLEAEQKRKCCFANRQYAIHTLIVQVHLSIGLKKKIRCSNAKHLLCSRSSFQTPASAPSVSADQFHCPPACLPACLALLLHLHLHAHWFMVSLTYDFHAKVSTAALSELACLATS